MTFISFFFLFILIVGDVCMWFLRPLSLMLLANIDTLSISKAFGLKKIKIPFGLIILISFLSSLIPFLVVYYGSILLVEITHNQQSVQFFGAGFLIAIGIYFIVSFLMNEDKVEKQISKSSTLSSSKGVILSLFLSIDDLGIFIAAYVMGYNLYLMFIINFILKILCFIAGKKIADKLALKLFGRYAGLAAGIFMVLLGWISLF